MKTVSRLGFVALATSMIAPVAYAANEDVVIVTATRTAQTADESLASVTVITQEDIQRQQAKDLHDVLSGVAGLDMINSGGFGKPTGLYMRGTNTGHTLVLIDGVQVGSATLGEVAYQDIPVDMIERIEIVRGPRASLYGSEAVGGVIQIFTRKGTDKTRISFSAGGGSEQSKQLTGGISGKRNKTSFSLFASAFETEGFDAKTTQNPDNDGYERSSVNTSIKHQLNKTDYVEATALISEATNEYDGTGVTTDYQSETQQKVLGLKGVFNATANWQVTVSANQSQDNSDEFKDSIKTSEFNTRRNTLLWQNDLVMNPSNLLTIGVEKQDTSISGTSAHTVKERQNQAAFIQNQWTKGDNDLLLALRQDDNNAYGNNTTGNIAWGHTFGYQTRFTASAGTAFKAPTFNDLYYPDTGSAKGNPDVLPEESETFELGLKQGVWQASIYQTNIENLIQWDNATGIWMPTNIASARINGFEFQVGARLNGWDSKLQLSLIDPVDNETGNTLAKRVKQSLRIDLDKDFGNYSLGSTIRLQGTRYISSSTELAGYGLVDLRAEYNLDKHWSLSGKVNNALDKDYTLNKGYNTQERYAFLSINYKN